MGNSLRLTCSQPTDEHGNFLPLPEWKPVHPKPEDWPSHIHPPKEVAEHDVN